VQPYRANDELTRTNVARPLAFLVAAAFALAPFVIWFSFPREQDHPNWSQGMLALGYEIGAALLAAGAGRWYGKKARLLRVWGFVLLFAGALVTITLAFALVPLVLLAAPSLRNREYAPATA
jgi:hypothetical protein